MKEKECRECGETLEQTGRLTYYCPSCDVCPECFCEQVDGNFHHSNCSELSVKEEAHE